MVVVWLEFFLLPQRHDLWWKGTSSRMWVQSRSCFMWLENILVSVALYMPTISSQHWNWQRYWWGKKTVFVGTVSTNRTYIPPKFKKSLELVIWLLQLIYWLFHNEFHKFSNEMQLHPKTSVHPFVLEKLMNALWFNCDCSGHREFGIIYF